MPSPTSEFAYQLKTFICIALILLIAIFFYTVVQPKQHEKRIQRRRAKEIKEANDLADNIFFDCEEQTPPFYSKTNH